MPIGDAQDEVLVIYPTFYSIVGLGNNYARRGVSLTMGFQAEGVPALSLTSRVTSPSFCFVPPPHIVSLTLGLVGRAGQTLRGSMWHPAAAACPLFDHPGCGPSQALWPPLPPGWGSALPLAPTMSFSLNPSTILSCLPAATVPVWWRPGPQPGPRGGGRGWSPVTATRIAGGTFSVQPPHSWEAGASAAFKAPGGPSGRRQRLCPRGAPVGVWCFPPFTYVYFLICLQTIC